MYCSATDCDVNRTIAPGLEALRWTLLDLHYSDAAAFDICHHVLEHGTLAGAPLLEAEDEAAAEAAYVASLPAVPFDSPEWGASDDDAADEVLAAEHDAEQAIFAAAGIGPAVMPSALEPAFRPVDAWPVLPPVAGGSDEADEFHPELEPYQPTQEDLDWYANWLDGRERSRAYLDGFNAERRPETELPA